MRASGGSSQGVDRAGEGVRMGGCERGCRNFFLKLNAGCMVTITYIYVKNL